MLNLPGVQVRRVFLYFYTVETPTFEKYSVGCYSKFLITKSTGFELLGFMIFEKYLLIFLRGFGFLIKKYWLLHFFKKELGEDNICSFSMRTFHALLLFSSWCSCCFLTNREIQVHKGVLVKIFLVLSRIWPFFLHLGFQRIWFTVAKYELGVPSFGKLLTGVLLDSSRFPVLLQKVFGFSSLGFSQVIKKYSVEF